MQDHRSPQAHEDLYTEIMESASQTGRFILETEGEHPDIEFEVSPADKATSNRLRRAMPDGMLDSVDMPDNLDDLDDISVDDFDLSEVSIKDMTFTEEGTEQWLDSIADHFSHSHYSRTEIKNIFSSLEDEYFLAAGSYLMEMGGNAGPITGFHRG